MKYLAFIIFSTLFLVTSLYALNSKNSNSFKNSSEEKKMSDLDKSNLETIVFGAGCFWGVEKLFKNQTGVITTQAGYADGLSQNPSYKEITQYSNKFNPENHAEVVKVVFDKTQTSAQNLIKVFFENHDPTQTDGQGNDKGTQYRSLILTENSQTLKIAENLKNLYQTQLSKAGFGKIQTQIKVLQKFYSAEEYHQDYLAKNPFGYCPNHATGVKFLQDESANSNLSFTKLNSQKTQKTQQKSAETKQAPSAFLQKLKTDLQKSKSILVVEMENCGFCEEFKRTIGDKYAGDLPLNYVDIKDFSSLNLDYKVEATPTILFIEDGKIKFKHLGTLPPKDFYLALGKFKLGELSEAFQVAFANSTDARFCKQYDLFKNTGAGVFVDKLSGAKLFSTKDRFNSGSGWLSFSDAIKDSVYLLEDNSYGMRRIEVRSKSSGIHLGHLFYDAPNGGTRYCINATVLDFVADWASF